MRTSLLLMWLFAISLSRAQDVASNYDALVPNHYFEFSLKLVKETAGFTPPVAARAFGYMGLTLYESVVPGMPGYLSSQGRLFEFY